MDIKAPRRRYISLSHYNKVFTPITHHEAVRESKSERASERRGLNPFHQREHYHICRPIIPRTYFSCTFLNTTDPFEEKKLPIRNPGMSGPAILWAKRRGVKRENESKGVREREERKRLECY